MANKKSFVMYDDWRELFLSLPTDKAGELIQAVFTYREDATAKPTDPAINAIFQMIKARLDADAELYAAKCAKNKAIANERQRTLTNVNERIPNVTDNDNDNDNDKDIKDKKENIKRKSIFVKPSVEEVRAYCNERNNSVDPQTFVDFYAAKGWKVGSASMKDWKACVRTWEKREQPKPKQQSFGNQRNYDFAELEKKLLQG